MPGGMHAGVQSPHLDGYAERHGRPDRGSLIEVAIDLARPRLELRVPADKDALPLVRQAMRALGQSAGAEAQALHDGELALTEACANAVKHAYRDGDGEIDVTIEGRRGDIVATVRDSGCGMAQPLRRRPGTVGGLGLMLIEAVTEDVEIRSRRGSGTEISMALPIDGTPAASESAVGADSLAQLVARRMVAMAAAQTDMVPERITEALLAAEIVTRHASSHAIGDSIRMRIERLPSAVEVKFGRLEPDGADAVLRSAEMPVVGSVVERLADAVWTVPAEGWPDGGEDLALRFAA